MKNRCRPIFKLFVLTVLLSFFSTQGWTHHLQGAELTYTCIGNNQYKFTLTTYTDCPTASFSNTPSLLIYSNSCASQNFGLPLTLESGYPLDITNICSSDSTECNGGLHQGTEKYVFTGITTLNSTCSDWAASYWFPARYDVYTNLQGTTNSIYVQTEINPTLSNCNNSPQFIQTEPQYVGCLGDTIHLNYQAYDIDGDSLVYSLTDVLAYGGAIGNFGAANYSTGFSGQNPILGAANIDSNGIVTLIPSAVQFSALAIKVEEYRNGVKIGEITRDFSIVVANCNNTAPKITAVNGNPQYDNIVHLTIPANIPFLAVANVFDPEVAAGTQWTNAYWDNFTK